MDLVWTKLVINMGIFPLTALFEVPNGRPLYILRARALIKLAVEEAT
ncbi:hypothetical protein X474_02540 [Dethiosulfatarculus sandiegensis]|uniref:Ketopantoate reductase C-terminal domain-containing protein n=1 Tax=Dethiosulfatarculus sandiegensis TaxID=1429043 RepID=A0A0D2JC36_9BACT|nr:hypothetical protein X474_02540 [Dethiosulfatarculus sandiegensis]